MKNKNYNSDPNDNNEPRNLAGMTHKETLEYIQNASEFELEQWRQNLLNYFTFVEGIEPARDEHGIIYSVKGDKIILHGKRVRENLLKKYNIKIE